MIIYFVIIIFLLIFSSCKNKYLYFFTLLLLIIIGGFRGYDVGTDTTHYLALYETYGSVQSKAFLLTEPGWVALNLFVYNYIGDYRAVVVIAQVLILTPIFLRLWKSTKAPVLGVLFYVLLYYYLNSFNVTRQFVAIAFIFYSMPFLLEGQTKKFYLFVLVACLFHLTSGVCFLMPFLMRLPKLSMPSIVILLLSSYILGILFIPRIISYVPFFGKYMVYVANAGEASGSFSRLLLNGFYIVLYMYLDKNKYMKYFFYGIIIYNLFAFNPVIGRAGIYFMISQLFIISNLSLKNKTISLQLKGIFLIYGLVTFVTLLNANVGEVVPYYFD